MGSRILQSGTIISRTTSLLRSGVLKERPLWLDVVETFPPFVPTQHNRTAEKGRPPTLRYTEDALKKEFDVRYEVKDKKLWQLDGIPSNQMSREMFVQKWLDKLQGGASKQKAEEETFEELKSAGVDITAVAAARVGSPISSQKNIEDPLLKALHNVQKLLQQSK
eukprot:Em0015g79a